MANRTSSARTSQPARQDNKPAHEVRLGRIRCTIWRNEHEKSGTWYSMTLTRSYKDQQGQWKSATSFGRDDLLVVGEVCRRALWWIQEQYSKVAQSHREPGQDTEAEGDGGDQGNAGIPF